MIPDLQSRPGSPNDHLIWAARYIADRDDPPTRGVLIGDVADMPSLSSWNKKGSLETEGHRIQADRDAAYQSLEIFFGELMRLGVDDIDWHLTEGNHENRLDRAMSADPRLIGLIDRPTFYGWQDFGLTVHEFMRPVHLDGITYCHLFDLNENGNTTGRRSGQAHAKMQVQRVKGTSVAGHRQGYDHARRSHPYARPWENETHAIIAGSFYLHREAYRGPTDGYERHGIVMLNEVNGWGKCEPMFVSMEYLERKYK